MTSSLRKTARPRPLEFGDLQLGGAKPLFILGPCVMESPAFTRRMARKISEIANKAGISWVFKASYDKANRTSVSSFRGTSVRQGCEILATIRADLNVPVTTDVHSPEEAEIAGEFIDILQIPAFLCRQTDLLRAAAKTDRPVNVKKGQFLAPWDVAQIARKLVTFGCSDYFFTERGTTFGYNNLVADMRSLCWIRELGYHVIFDATHSVQRPGGAGDSTSGDGALAPHLARAAVATGCDGLFIETHENPTRALSDGPNQIALKHLPKLLDQILAIHSVVHDS
jgi:2-dehydro-3-deoxyphosphooctonate aldolase (KDO 8-P synthase)